jgi:hypothetical protein
MSFSTTSPPSPDAPTSVFVDESGRRRAHTRLLARAVVAGAGIYVLIVIAGLTGSVSLPGVHLGVLGHAAAGRAHASRLGPKSKTLPLPSALQPKSARARSTPTTKTSPAATTLATDAPTGANPAQGTPGTGNHAIPTTGPSSPTTRSTLPVTTTTTAHGRPTTTAHGPPSTKPGLGKGRK